MNAAPTYRWGLGFISLRWRHMFWLLPLTGMLTGLGLQLWAMYGSTAVGIIQVCPPHGLHTGTPLVDVESDEILSKTVDSLGLSEQWAKSPETCVLKLRKMIRSEPVPGTSLIEVRVSGRNRREAIEIWKALLAHTNQHFLDIRSAAEDAKLAAMEATVKAMELELDQMRIKLSSALKKDKLTPGAPGVDLKQLKIDFDAAQRTLELVKIHLLSNQMRCVLMENPVISHEEPVISPPWTHRDFFRPLSLHAGIGLSIGVLLSPLMAYLLEFLFPRRQPGLEQDT